MLAYISILSQGVGRWGRILVLPGVGYKTWGKQKRWQFGESQDPKNMRGNLRRFWQEL